MVPHGLRTRMTFREGFHKIIPGIINGDGDVTDRSAASSGTYLGVNRAELHVWLREGHAVDLTFTCLVEQEMIFQHARHILSVALESRPSSVSRQDKERHGFKSHATTKCLCRNRGRAGQEFPVDLGRTFWRQCLQNVLPSPRAAADVGLHPYAGVYNLIDLIEPFVSARRV